MKTPFTKEHLPELEKSAYQLRDALQAVEASVKKARAKTILARLFDYSDWGELNAKTRHAHDLRTESLPTRSDILMNALSSRLQDEVTTLPFKVAQSIISTLFVNLFPSDEPRCLETVARLARDYYAASNPRESISFDPETLSDTSLFRSPEEQAGRAKLLEFLQSLNVNTLQSLVIVMYAGRDPAELTNLENYRLHVEYFKGRFNEPAPAILTLIEKSMSLTGYLEKGIQITKRLGIDVIETPKTVTITLPDDTLLSGVAQEDKRQILLSINEGGFVAQYRASPYSAPEMLPTRYDLFQYTGGIAWGYSGTGVQNLAAAIAAKLWESDIAIDVEHAWPILVEKCLSKLPPEAGHTLNASALKALVMD